MEALPQWIEDEGEEEKEGEEDGHHDVKNFFPTVSIGDPRKEEGKEDRGGEYGPDFDEGDRFGPGIGCGDDDRVFVRAQRVVIEGDQKENPEHWEEFLELIAVNRPEKRSPFPELFRVVSFHRFLCDSHWIFPTDCHIYSFFETIKSLEKLF
jgi:hypothetical protein